MEILDSNSASAASESLSPASARFPGSMAHVFATHDWARTPLGPVAGWSEVLKQTVRSMLSLPFAGALFWGPEMLLLYNDGYRQYLGGKHPSALGIPAEASWAEVWPVVGPHLEAARGSGTVFSVKNIFIPILLDGRMVDRYWTYCFYPIYDGNEIVGVSQTSFDSTSEVLAERGLKESEARASRILQSIGDAVIVTDAATRVTRMNPVAERLTCWTSDEADGRDLKEVFRLLHEGTRNAWPTPADTVLATGQAAPLSNHTLLVHQDGTERPIEHSGAPIRDDSGDISGIVLTFRDVTDRQRAEAALARSEDRVRLALSAANGLGTWDWDVPNDRVYTDAKFAYFFGVAPQSATVGTPIEDFMSVIHVKDRDRVKKQVNNALESHGEFASEYRVVQPDGSFRWLLSVGRVIDTEAGLRFSGLAVETTERKRAELALDSSEMRVRLALETAQLGAWELDVVSGELTSSARCKSYFGRKPDDPFTLEDFYNSLHPEDRDAIVEAVTRAAAERTIYRAEYRVIWPDGSLHWIVASGSVSEDETEERQRMLGVVLDVTERRKAATALLQSEKLAAVGRLAAAIAHEINNPLESVEPFFTTKDISGTGLGLWVSQEIVTRHEGSLRLRSSQRRGASGTVFTLFLPLVSSQAEGKAFPLPAASNAN